MRNSKLSKSFFLFFISFSILTSICFSQELTIEKIDPSRYPNPVSPKIKKTICTATINSDTEKKLFKEYLHSDYFDFIELVNDNRDINFLSRACANKNIQCDVVILSAHFAGRFQNDKGTFILPLSSVEKTSCESCENILQNPQAVYTFGCTTLAGRGNSVRSPEQFYETLVNNLHQTESEARNNVAKRYSAIGETFAQSMRRIFRGVPVLNGFNDKGPLGKQSEPMLRTMFGSMLPDQWPHDGKLDDLERRIISETYYKELDQWRTDQQSGELFEKYLKTKHVNPRMFSVMGPTYADLPGIKKSSLEDEVANNMCLMRLNSNSKLMALNNIVETGDVNSVVNILPQIIEIQKNSSKISTAEKDFLNQLSINEKLRQMLIGDNGILIRLSNSPMERLETADLSHYLGFIDQNNLEKIYIDAAIFVWNNASYTIKKIELMKKLNFYLNTVSTFDLSEKSWFSTKIWDLISLYKSADQNFISMAISNLETTMTSALNEHQKRVASLEEVKINNGGESIINIRKLQVDIQKENINTFCKQIYNLNISKTEVINRFQSSADNLKRLNLKFCNELLNVEPVYKAFQRAKF